MLTVYDILVEFVDVTLPRLHYVDEVQCLEQVECNIIDEVRDGLGLTGLELRLDVDGGYVLWLDYNILAIVEVFEIREAV